MSKQTIIITSILFLFGMFFFFQNPTKDDAKMVELIKNGAYLVDVRTPAEFAEGSVEGAVNIPLDVIGSKTNLLKDKENIIVFCRSGNRSSSAKAILEKAGFKNVYNGGGWKDVQKMVKKAKSQK